jgi:tRNA A37 methylthiotransferase MiaB
MKKNNDIIFCSIPYSDLDHLYSAPAILKGIVKNAGYTSHTVDFGINLLNLCERDIKLFNKVQLFFISDYISNIEKENKILEKWFDEVINYFIINPTKYISFSCLSYMQHKTCIMLIRHLKKNNIKSKILVGGRGAKVAPWSILSTYMKLTQNNYEKSFADFLLEKKLIDHAIIGDGEDAILEILGKKKLNKKIVAEISRKWADYPKPDYDDYRFNQYLFGRDNIAFPITGSKGCVRDCDFCDVKFHFGKYKFRTGQSIAEEILFIQNKYGFNKFVFTDSLINGNLKTLKEFCEIIANHNELKPEKKIRWTGQYICRSIHQMPEKLYELMQRSGVDSLTIGAESGSNNVLKKINKKTTVEALYHEISMFEKYNIRCVLLTFVGHWEETWQDFIDHCQMFIKILPYIRSATISAITFGYLGSLFDGTPAHEKVNNQLIIQAKELREYLWFNQNNPSTLKERIFRRFILFLLGKKLQIPTIEEENKLNHLYNYSYPHKKTIIDFAKQYPVENEKAEETFNNFEIFLQKILKEDQLEIELDIEASGVIDQPTLILDINKQNIFKEKLADGFKNLKISYDIKNLKKITLDISMEGKKKNETIFKDGKIIKDKFIIIKNFKVNKFNLLIDREFLHNYTEYLNEKKEKKQFTNGFWTNSKISLEFDLPFSLFYNSRTKKNINLNNTPLEYGEDVKDPDVFNKFLKFAKSL